MARYVAILAAVIVAGAVCAFVMEAIEPPPKPGDDGFVSIFDGKSLQGWHISSKTGHGTGGRWVVENGAIVGSHDRPGNGGILITDAQYGNFEVVLEMNNNFGPDSGLFLRSTEQGKAYQAYIDYHTDGSLMGVYGEGFAKSFSESNFRFLEAPDKIKSLADKGGIALQVHGGNFPVGLDLTKLFVRYRNIRVKVLDGKGVKGSSGAGDP